MLTVAVYFVQAMIKWEASEWEQQIERNEIDRTIRACAVTSSTDPFFLFVFLRPTMTSFSSTCTLSFHKVCRHVAHSHTKPPLHLSNFTSASIAD
jgi:hypothetical protein